MNTKTEQISSGLVAHIAAFKEALNGTKGDLDAWLECNDESEVRQAIFGVIAENQRKQQLEEQVAKQSTALKLARSALMHDGYPCGNGCKCRACEALAAIDALGETV